MSKTLKYVGLTVAAVLVLSIAVLGWSKVRTTTIAAVRNIGEQIEQAKPDPQLYAEIQVGLEDFDRKIQDYEDRLAEVDQKRTGTAKRLTVLQKQFKQERSILVRAKQYLDQEETYYFIGARRYSRSEINADAMMRLAHCKQLEAEMQTVGQSLEQLDAAIDESRRTLAKAKTSRTAKMAELQTLMARLENAKLLDKVNELTDAMRASPQRIESELAHRFNRFKRRVETVERRTNGPGSPLTGSGTIVWDAADDSDIGDKLTNFLDGSSDSYLGNPEVY